jgi:SAM-dependent methyltransferase
VSNLPFPLPPELAGRLASALDVEGKIARAVEALGPVGDRDVLLLDGEGSALERAMRGLDSRIIAGSGTAPFRAALPDASVDVVVSLWSGFRGVDAGEVAEADRVLRPGGRLLVIHDYGRDDVSGIRADREEYGAWSHRNGPFLKNGFRLRVLHCFWTFESMEATSAFLADAFGDPGRAVAATLKRPRLSHNVALYHRTRGGEPAAG